ncbi:hypothetical protein VBJ55_22265 [Enterobacter hormaechei]|uniref:Antirestriction protein n=2 Tax=Loughboroughvirus ZCSE2 TaxID=2734117 RepID=A0A4D6DW66_9CAUD|nr:hypothetical protein HOV36_gp62 [Salmonella phage ZCSE2]MEA4022356.1 hypothetical protein [Enterobacter hormaechei]QMV47898.1 hypothetical protein [Salmonella phage S144]UOK16660.1 hypothetical protein HBKIJOIA_00059 [Salmonella phage S1]WQZ00514.1 hypothetical protein AEV23_00070 [Klebsiella phage VB_KpM-AEV23]QBZ70565.1 hypothetical protein [Salmonella phage ZCSE2]
MTPFIINQHNCYFYLTNELVEMMQGQELTNCRCFDNFDDFYAAVHEIYPAIESVEELYGSYIELYYDDELDKAVVEHSFLNAVFDIETLAEDISNYTADDE